MALRKVATANKTFNGTFASVAWFAVRYRSLYRKPINTGKGPLTLRYVSKNIQIQVIS